MSSTWISRSAHRSRTGSGGSLVVMSDDKRPADETQPVRPEGGGTLPPPPAAAPADPAVPPAAESAAEPAVARRGFRERLGRLRSSGGSRTFGLAALIASALAGIIVGGLGFAAVHAVTDDGPGDRGGWMQREADDRGPGGGPGRGPGQGESRGGPAGLPGQLPPTTVPDDEDGGLSS